MTASTPPPPPPPPGYYPGEGVVPLLRVVGTCRWTGFDFHGIDTGYLNLPNWLLAGYSIYHRVASRASQPIMFMTGPRYRHQRRCMRDATDFEFLISFNCKTTIGQGTYPRCAIYKINMHVYPVAILPILPQGIHAF